MTHPHDKPPAFLTLVPVFDSGDFAEPEPWFWPGYFWLWNDRLDADTIRGQLQDMVERGARSVVMLPMPHAFRPDSTNNFLTPDYLTDGFFDFVRLAVEEAARLGMHWWLYDEGGWPSGQAAGKVLDGHPELAAQKLTREPVAADRPFTVPPDALALVVEEPRPRVFRPGTTWTPASQETNAFLYRLETGGLADLLNPAVARRFIELTHERYNEVLGQHFGQTIRFAFTDEPAVHGMRPPTSIPWTPGMEQSFREQVGRDLLAELPHLFQKPGAHLSRQAMQTRVEFYDVWTNRFAQAYFMPLRQWCRQHNLASGGHLGGEDETLGAVQHGFGHALRQLRTLDVPGVDVIWRQLFPGQARRHHFPKFASSAAHQNGTRYAFTESFAVFGNGLTPAQMKWLVDYQFVRGINLLVGACYPYGTREHHMTGERPHFGSCNPVWDHIVGFHAYAARLGCCLSMGEPAVSVALYYPVRDLWALGDAAKTASASHDELAAALTAAQCDFDLIDDDALTNAVIDNGRLAVGPMRYGAIVCAETQWMQPEARARLQAFAAAGGTVLCLKHAPGVAGEFSSDSKGFQVMRTPSELVGRIAPILSLLPSSDEIRATARIVRDGRIVFLFNEGDTPYAGTVANDYPHVYRLDPLTGTIEKAPDGEAVPVNLAPGASALFLFSCNPVDAPDPLRSTDDIIELDAGIRCVPRRRVMVGEHDFEVLELTEEAVPFDRGHTWHDWLGEDFSGEVEYRATFVIPASWEGAPLRLETGEIAYAATVLLDGKPVGRIAWPPWHLVLPPGSAGSHELVIRVANTLANELTSTRVTEQWSTKSGPGWPSPYHKRALEFERDTKAGGLAGPIRLRRMCT